jgi:muconolactone delta-isomerase
MKIIAFFKLKEGVDLSQAMPFLADEEKMAWQLYLDGKLREFYLTSTPGLVIDIFEYETMEAFHKDMNELPLMKANLMDITAYDLLPFKNMEFLFKEEYKTE